MLLSSFSLPLLLVLKLDEVLVLEDIELRARDDIFLLCIDHVSSDDRTHTPHSRLVILLTHGGVDIQSSYNIKHGM